MENAKTSLPSIDVIIPISELWRFPYLIYCCRSIKRQEYEGDINIIVVHTSVPSGDNNVDSLADFCREICATLLFVKQEDPAFNIAKAYNIGVSAGSGDAVACIDCDTLMHESTLAYAATALLNGEVAILPVTRTKTHPGAENFERISSGGLSRDEWDAFMTETRWASSEIGNVVFPRVVFEEIGGYDERFYGWGAADSDMMDRTSRVVSRCSVIKIGCPKIIHMEHPDRSFEDRFYAERNRGFRKENNMNNVIVANSEKRSKAKHRRDSFDFIFRGLLDRNISRAGRPVYNRTFAGATALHSAFTYEQIDKVLKSVKVNKIVEIGTGQGALSMYLGLVGARLGIPVYTIDKNTIKVDETRVVLEKLGVNIITLNALCEPGISEVSNLISGTPVYLICDNGDKKKEFNTFCGSLVSGSVVSVHDWGKEIQYNDVSDVVEKLRMVPFMKEKWDFYDMMFATWCVS